MKKIFLIFIYILTINPFFAQEEKTSWTKEYISFGGYVKYINSVNFHNAEDLMTDNLVHNRFNLKVYFSDAVKLNLGMRNRIFYGDMLKSIFFSASSLDNDKGMVDLTFLPISKKNLVMQSTFDRLNINFSYKKWDVTLGRQRINWGINTVWNPNDLYNTSNFLDFDYEEKPGTDAVRMVYETGEMSNVEIAYKTNKDFDEALTIVAAKYQFNFKSYDVQLIAGKFLNDYTIGIGWAGNIKNLGFKGEANYFINKDDSDENALVASFSLDYAFKNGINWMFSGLYNGNYKESGVMPLLRLYNSELNAKNLFPSEYALFSQFSGDFGPAWRWSLGGIYATENNFTIIIPQLSYAIKDNWNIDLYGQSFFADIPNIKQRNIIYLRTSWNF